MGVLRSPQRARCVNCCHFPKWSRGNCDAPRLGHRKRLDHWNFVTSADSNVFSSLQPPRPNPTPAKGRATTNFQKTEYFLSSNDISLLSTHSISTTETNLPNHGRRGLRRPQEHAGRRRDTRSMDAGRPSPWHPTEAPTGQMSTLQQGDGATHLTSAEPPPDVPGLHRGHAGQRD